MDSKVPSNPLTISRNEFRPNPNPNRDSTTSFRAATFDFTRSGRLGVYELMAERRPELRFPVPLTHSCQFAISRSAPGQQIFLTAAKRHETTSVLHACK